MTIHEQGTIAIAVAGTFALLAFIALGLRTYVKLAITKTFGWNDVGMVAAWVVYMILGTLLVLGVIDGIGGHIFQSTIPKISQVLQYIFILEIIYVVLTSIMKGSIAITMMRWTKNRRIIIAFWVSIAMDIMISLAFILYLVFQCQPISYAWQMLDPTKKGKCLPFTGQLYMGLALCAVTFTLDILLMSMPFLMMKENNMNKILRKYVYGIFSLGIAATIANIIRLFAILKLQKSKDQLFDAAPVFTWSAVEVSIGLIIAGLIELGPLMSKLGFKGFESYAQFANLGDDDTMKLYSMDSMNKNHDDYNISAPMAAPIAGPFR